MLRGAPLIFSLLVLLFAGVKVGEAQVIRIDLHNADLQDALLYLRSQADLDVVFASSLVADRRATCRYEGAEAEEALRCVLEESGLYAARVRPKQYVLLPPEPSPTAETRRGILAGFVSDARTGEVLPGAHVYLPELKAGTVTNDAGYFALPALPVGEYGLRISYLGYAAVETRLGVSEKAHTIALHPTALQSEAIVVEAGSSDRIDVETIPGLLSESVARLEELPTFPGESDLFQALQWYPGIRKSGELSGGLIVRGGAPDQNLYLLDGAPVYHPWHAFSLISTFQTETFKNIRLYRGSFPAEYGGRISGVLDAQMKDGSRKNPSAVVALSALSGRFIVETPATRKSSFMISGRRSYLDKLIGTEHPVADDDGRRDTMRTGYYFYDMSAKYTYRLSSRRRMSLSYYEGGDNLDLRLPFDLSLDFSSWLRPADLLFEVGHNWKNRLVSGRYQYLHSRRLFVTSTAYYSSYWAKERSYMRPTSSSVLNSDYRVHIQDVGFKLDFDFYHSLQHQAQGGIHLIHRQFDSDLQATVRRSTHAADSLSQRSRLTAPELAFYVQDVWQPARHWSIRPGIRVSFFGGGRYTDVTPGISFQYVVDPSYLVLRGGVSRQVQYLHRLRDQHSFTYDLVSSRWIPAGSTVRPSRAVQASSGFESRLLPGLTLTGDAYWRHADHVLLPEDELRTKNALVGPGIETGALLGQYVDGKARAYGIELGTSFEKEPWHVLVSYAGGKTLTRSPALQETRFREDRFDVPRAIRFNVRYRRNRFEVSVSADVRSGYPNTVPVARYAVGDPLEEEDETPPVFFHRPDVNNGRLPTYVRADIAGAYRFRLLGAKWKARIHVHNVTSRRNVIGRLYDPTVEPVRVMDRRGLPILPLFEIEMEL